VVGRIHILLGFNVELFVKFRDCLCPPHKGFHVFGGGFWNGNVDEVLKGQVGFLLKGVLVLVLHLLDLEIKMIKHTPAYLFCILRISEQLKCLRIL